MRIQLMLATGVLLLASANLARAQQAPSTPAAPTDDAPEQDSLAAILLRRLGVPEAAILEESVTKDSGTASAPGENGLE